MTIQDIEKAIAKLPVKKLTMFRTWFYKFEARVWDEQFEKDVKTGKLDTVAEKAIEDYKRGNCRELFALPEKQWKVFCEALDRPAREIPRLKKLFTTEGD